MSHSPKKTTLFVSCFLLSVSAILPAKVSIKDVLETKLESGFDCFYPSTIKNWKIVDNKNLIISTSKGKQSYLLRFQRTCHILEMTNALQLVSKNRRVCHKDFVQVMDVGGHDACTVQIIEQLDANLVKNLFDAEKEAVKVETKSQPKPKLRNNK